MPVDEARIPRPIAADLELDLAGAACGGAAPPPPLLVVDAGEAPPADPALPARAVERARAALPARGRLVIAGAGAASARELARLRAGLWPALHVARVYRFERGGSIERTDARGTQVLAGAGLAECSGYVLAAHFREHALSPAATAEKFDAAAAGWNGDPSSPAYGHYRWMRRLLAVLGKPRPGERVLDAGAGAGWVGLEAALLGGRLSSFDPSAEMVRLVRQNAALLGVEVDARVGFTEEPPFAETFDLVLSSGVISFAPDAGRFLDGLARMVAPGGRLVIGDLNPLSRGFRRRRAERMVLPCRELNALPRDHVAADLRARGFRVDWLRHYQNTSPFPELLFRSQSRFVCRLLLQANRLASALDAACGARAAPLFDSWIVGATREARGITRVDRCARPAPS